MTIREKQIIQKGIAAQSEELLRTLLSVVQDGICFLSPEHDILYQNPRYEVLVRIRGQEGCRKMLCAVSWAKCPLRKLPDAEGKAVRQNGREGSAV